MWWEFLASCLKFTEFIGLVKKQISSATFLKLSPNLFHLLESLLYLLEILLAATK
jgi:hypothetical protein